MAALDDLIQQISDEGLRNKIQEEANKLTKQKKFGLVFEEHLPECTPLYDIPVKRGSKVSFKKGNIKNIYKVIDIQGEKAICVQNEGEDPIELKTDELVTIAEFGDPIYPCLKPIDSVCNAPNSDLWHTLIEADNYHALQLLEYLYAGKVDCIYIDPPYNTGAKDWKYNNNYVDGNDSYRHSKWLSFMKKRLVLAKKLLNPADSVLIVTIDDKEYLHLGCLLEELFPNGKMTMISSIVNPVGKAKKGGVDFSKTDEYIFFLQFGKAAICSEIRETSPVDIRWQTFRRSSLANGRGKHGVGACGPNQFYPIYVDNNTHRIVEIGQPIKEGVDRFSVKQIDGCSTVFPVRKDGNEINWGATRETALDLLKNGYFKVIPKQLDEPQQYVIKYLTSGVIKDINNGKITITGRDETGGVVGYYDLGKEMVPTTNWNKPAHNATSYGTDLLTKLFINPRFDYAKSLYAVRDTLCCAVANNPNALIVDFFAGSGTTLHAVNLLNAEDGGNRRCIMVTNNEVSATEAAELQDQGCQPGDEDWDKLGIARYVTWERTRCSIKGCDVNGNLLQGTYGVEYESYEKAGGEKKGFYKKIKKQTYPNLAKMKMCEGFETNAAFFKLGFLNKDSVARKEQLKELMSVLWMKAGAIGKCPEIDGNPDMIILPENRFALLNKESAFLDFEEEIKTHPEIETVFIVTDSENAYRRMIAGLPDKTTYQLYRDYLDNFRINTAR